MVHAADVETIERRRSAAVLGYTNVRVYRGGKRDWIDSGQPIEG